MSDWNNEKGWSRHQHFGLRSEWLDLYLADRQGWRISANLGNRQVDSLQAWLKTAGLVNERGDLTALGKRLAAEGSASLGVWELIWVNTVFNFPTARWYARLGNGEWTTTDLKQRIRLMVPRLAETTASNAIMELAGLLERTPVGGELGQGLVLGVRPRRIKRTGHKPGDLALVYAMGRLYLQRQQERLAWDENLTWPWIVFGCNRQFVLERLTIIDQSCFDIDERFVLFRNLDREWWQCGDIMTT